MKKKIISLLLALCSIGVFAQSNKEEVKYHYISLQNEDDVPLDYHYYVEKVLDGRQFKDNLGTVLKGPFNAKVLARFEKPFEQELMDYLTKVLPKTESKLPITLRIKDLYISEYTTSTSETGFATVVADVIENKDGIDYIIGTVSANIEGDGIDVTGKHDDRIKQALIKCIAKYEILRDDEKVAIPFNNEAPEQQMVPVVPAKGVYISFADILRNTPKEDSGFSLLAEGDKYYIFNGYTNTKAEDYYGYSDGETLYLNVSKYARKKYYAKTERMGNKYFMKDVAIDHENAVAMSAMFGVIGSLIFTSVNEASLSMLVDCNTGHPVFLSHSEVKTMLEPYPDLLKEYKKSSRTSDDIRTVLTQYFQQVSAK